MALQLKGSNGGGNNRQKLNNGTFGSGEIEETPEMKELRMKREADAAAAKEAIAKKQEEMRQKAMVLEQMEAAKKERERIQREEEEIRNNPALAAERERRLAAEKAAEEQRARFKAEEEAKIQAERRVQEKKMNQTDALIAAIRAQVEKEKAQKEAASMKTMPSSASSSKKDASDENKPKYRTISPEEMAKLEEKKRLKAAGIVVEEKTAEPAQPAKTVEPEKPAQPSASAQGVGTGVSGGVSGVGKGPSLSNPLGDGPTLSNANKPAQSLGASMAGGGLGIDITATVNDTPSQKADENTVALDVEQINAAVEKSKETISFAKPVETVTVQPEPIKQQSVQQQPVQPMPVPEPVKTVPVPEPVRVDSGADTIIVDEGNAWGGTQTQDDEPESPTISWVDSGTAPTQVHAPEHAKESSRTSLVDDNGDIISVVPVRQRPTGANDVQSAYNIDFDDDDLDI